MPGFRRKISAVQRDFVLEIDRLKRFDSENQRRFSVAHGTGRVSGITRRQLHLLTESIFFAAHRAYENFVRDVFLLYCLEKQPKTGVKVKSYLRPKDFSHAERLIQSSMPFLDWTNPVTVIERSELYLDGGFPVKLPFATNQEVLRDYKRIRNHIAHNSLQSLEEYKKVLRKHYGTVPLSIPSPGEFLLVREKHQLKLYKLQAFFHLILKMGQDLT